MNRPFAKNFDTPDESITLGGVVEDIVEITGSRSAAQVPTARAALSTYRSASASR